MKPINDTMDADGETRYRPKRTTNRIERRHALRILGAVGIAGLAGCLGEGSGDAGDGIAEADTQQDRPEGETDTGSANTDETTTTDDIEGTTAGNDSQATETCDDLSGSLNPFDSGDREFAFGWDIPDTWEEYNENISSGRNQIGAMFGHSASATSASYPNNFTILQSEGAGDAEDAEKFLDASGQSEDVDPLVFDGQELRRTVRTRESATGNQWNIAIPDGDVFYLVRVSATADTEACFPAVEDIVYDVMNSFRPRER